MIRFRIYKWLAKVTARMAANAATKNTMKLHQKDRKAVEFAGQKRSRFMEVRELWEGDPS